MAKLTPKQEMFVKEYLVDLNATQAAIRAGYSQATAMEQGYQLLRKTSVQTALQVAMNARSQRTEITADRVLEELAKLAFSDMRDFAKWSEAGVTLISSDQLSAEAAACVSEVSQTITKDGGSIKFKLHDKKSSLELLGKHLGLFVERHEHTGKGGGPIETAVTISDKEKEQLILNVAKRIKANRAGTGQCDRGHDPGGETGLPG
jgi:phage terminase small subunit